MPERKISWLPQSELTEPIMIVSHYQHCIKDATNDLVAICALVAMQHNTD